MDPFKWFSFDFLGNINFCTLQNKICFHFYKNFMINHKSYISLRINTEFDKNKNETHIYKYIVDICKSKKKAIY